MEYRFLTAQDREALTKDRLLDLEVAHYKLMLRLAETVDTTEANSIRDQLIDLARRAQLHIVPDVEAENPAEATS